MPITNNQEYNALVDRLVNLEESRADIRLDSKEVYAEAKSKGYCPKTLRRIVRDKRKDPNQLREENDTYDIYAHAAGLIES